MALIPNRCLERLRAGETALGFGLFHLRTVAAAQLALTAGYDWLSIDMEHGAFSVHEATQISLAALNVGISPIVRIGPGTGAFGEGTRALDNGAQGLIIPQVSKGEEAAHIVQAFRYAPEGGRGWGGSAPQFGYAPPPVGEAQASLNRETLLVVVIETAEGVANAEAIAATPGIDVLLIGASDLSVDLGIAGKYDAPEIQQAFADVGAACRRHGKTLGMGGVYDETWTARYMALGARFVAGGADHGLLMSAAKSRAQFLRRLAADSAKA